MSGPRFTLTRNARSQRFRSAGAHARSVRDGRRDYDIEVGPPSGRSSAGRLSADWWGLVELERRLLEPYVRRAAEYEVEIRRAGMGATSHGRARA